MTVNTFPMNQCVLSDMKMYITSPLGTRKCCKHFQKGRAKMDHSEQICKCNGNGNANLYSALGKQDILSTALNNGHWL